MDPVELERQKRLECFIGGILNRLPGPEVLEVALNAMGETQCDVPNDMRGMVGAVSNVLTRFDIGERFNQDYRFCVDPENPDV